MWKIANSIFSNIKFVSHCKSIWLESILIDQTWVFFFFEEEASIVKISILSRNRFSFLFHRIIYRYVYLFFCRWSNERILNGTLYFLLTKKYRDTNTILHNNKEEEDTIIRSWEKVNFQVAIVKFYTQWPHRLVPF